MTPAATTPEELTATRAAKPSRNMGTSGGRLPEGPAVILERNIRATITMVGSSRATRNSLTMVAVSPVSFDTP